MGTYFSSDSEQNMYEQEVSTVLLVYAMMAEATPVVEHLQLKPVQLQLVPPSAPFVLFTGTHNGVEVYIATPGKDLKHGVDNVSTVPAAVLAYASIIAIKPNLVINAGTAGAFKAKGASIGDVYVVSSAAHHDRRIPIPGFDKYGVGEIATTPCKQLSQALGLKEGKVSTGNSLDMVPADQENIVKNDATLKEMECAAVAWVAGFLNVPFISIKSVTDLVDGDKPTHEEFLENLHSASKALQEVMPKVLDFVAGKKVKEL